MWALSHALQLSTPVEEGAFFPPGHMFTVVRTHLDEMFAAKDESAYIWVDWVWGLESLDRSEFNRWEPNDKRGTVALKGIDLYDRAAMEHLLWACEKFRTTLCSAAGCDYNAGAVNDAGKKLMAFRDNSHQCFLEEFLARHSATPGNFSDVW